MSAHQGGSPLHNNALLGKATYLVLLTERERPGARLGLGLGLYYSHGFLIAHENGRLWNIALYSLSHPPITPQNAQNFTLDTLRYPG